MAVGISPMTERNSTPGGRRGLQRKRANEPASGGPEPREAADAGGPDSSASLLLELTRNTPFGRHLEWWGESRDGFMNPIMLLLWPLRAVPLADLVNTAAQALDDLADYVERSLLDEAPREVVTPERFGERLAAWSPCPIRYPAFDSLARRHPEVAGVAHFLPRTSFLYAGFVLTDIAALARGWFAELTPEQAARTGIEPRHLWLVQVPTGHMMLDFFLELYWARHDGDLLFGGGQGRPAHVARSAIRAMVLNRIERGWFSRYDAPPKPSASAS